MGSLGFNRSIFAAAPAVVLATLLAPTPAMAFEPPQGWTLDISGDRAAVRLGASDTRWWSGRAQLSYRREGKGGVLFAIEPLRRFAATDLTLIAAGWRHDGPWSFYAEGGATPAADFHYRYSTEVEAYRRLGAGPWAAHAGYRYWAYTGQALHLFSPRLTRYGARSEVHGRVSIVHNATTAERSESAMARGHYDVRPWLRLGGGIAVGERIFDVTALPREPAPGWVAFAEARIAVGARDSVALLGRIAEEGSTFDQTAFGLSYRRSF